MLFLSCSTERRRQILDSTYFRSKSFSFYIFIGVIVFYIVRAKISLVMIREYDTILHGTINNFSEVSDSTLTLLTRYYFAPYISFLSCLRVY